MRLNKYIADCGIASRRKADILIADGKVKINGKIVTNLGTIVNENDTVEVEGKRIKKEDKKIYLMLNKPSGFLSSVSDDRGRKTVIDLIKKKYKERIYPVGRLDYETEGLLILTNDGEFANKVIHPSKNILKKYYVEIDKNINEKEKRNIEEGVDIGNYITSKSKLSKIDDCKYYITISEGKNRQVRKMFETQNKKVLYLKRVSIGNLKLENLKTGQFRELTDKEKTLLLNEK